MQGVRSKPHSVLDVKLKRTRHGHGSPQPLLFTLMIKPDSILGCYRLASCPPLREAVTVVSLWSLLILLRFGLDMIANFAQSVSESACQLHLLGHPLSHD